MTSPDFSRRALFGLGFSRLGKRLDAAGDVPVAPRPRAAPTLDEVAARWEAARRPRSEALWLPVHEALDAAVLEVAGEGPGRIATSVFGPQSTPGTRAAIAGLFDTVPPGGVVGLAFWSTGVVAQLLKAAVEFDPMPPGLPGVWGWGRRERLRQDLDHHADEIRYRSGALELRAGSLSDAVERLAAAVPALATAIERHGENVRARLLGTAEPYAAAHDGDVTLPVPYLLVVARKR